MLLQSMKKILTAQISLFVIKPIIVSHLDGSIFDSYIYFLYGGLSTDLRLHSFSQKLNFYAEDSPGVRVQ